MRGSSHTAALVCLYRAIESRRPPATRLFDDPFAPRFLGWRFRTALHLARLPVLGAAMPWSLVDGHWSGPRGTVSVRTRYIDDCLGEALRRGVKQVVILGAGFDCRAHRIPEIAQSRVFETDHPATQEVKKRRLGALRLPANETRSVGRAWESSSAREPDLPGVGRLESGLEVLQSRRAGRRDQRYQGQGHERRCPSHGLESITPRYNRPPWISRGQPAWS